MHLWGTLVAIAVAMSRSGVRYRFWGLVPELAGRYLRVVTLADRVTVHNAFPDRRFTP